ncbi:MAG: acetyltransferase, family [Caulobacteraceae bacterium]|nr:acetyltransferase, family [Caulobacteraceae bacterium]
MTVILETERLILRPPVEADLDGFAALMADEESARFIGGVQARSTAWRGMAALAGSWMLKGFSMFSVIERDSGQWIGRIGPWAPEGWPGTEVGWGLLRAHWGRGYAAEAAVASIDWAFDTLGWTEVIHTIAADNAPSKALAARLGSRYLRIGHLPPPWDLDLEVWGQSRAQWRARAR